MNTPGKEKDAVVTERLREHYPATVRLLAEQAFSRTAGAPLLGGNRVQLLHDATENYPAWLAAIASARRHIHFENYIIAEDAAGREFIASLAERARAGVSVRLLYDWMGCFGKSSRCLWQPLLDAGGEVRCFNPPQAVNPFGWSMRDHRKSLTVDGRIGFVSGLCVASSWRGDPERQIAPWRDTGVSIEGPAVADVVQAFAQAWAACGEPLPAAELAVAEWAEGFGNVHLRVIATTPSTSGLYRLDQLIAAMARKRLWLTDPYYLGTPSYMHALCAAAGDGVDVRLLVPSSTDIPMLSPLSRAGYRPLLEAGARVFEWNGPMIHAKTAVADGRWARVGSSNLNIASWMSNYELDVAVEDQAFARLMETSYEADLENATEIVLSHQRVQLRRGRQALHLPPNRRSAVSRRTATAVRLSNTMAMAMRQPRLLGPAEARLTLFLGLVLLAFSLITLYWPRLVALPMAAVSLWLAISFLLRSRLMLRKHRRRLRAAWRLHQRRQDRQ
jgi:cardiolipin synthase